MVAGDLVNTASRIQSARRAGHGARRRGDPPRDRADGRLRGRGQPRAEGQGRPDSALARAPRRLRRSRHAEVGRARGAVRRPRPRAAPDQGALPRLRGRGQARTSSRSPASPGSASRASAGSSTSTSTGSSRRRTGTAVAVSPTARASPTGRSRTWSGCARGSSRTRSRARRSPSSRAVVEEHIDDPEERRFVEPRLAHLLGLDEESARLRARGPLRRLAALLRAAGRRLPGGDALRGHAVGGRVAARLHRVPARVVPQLADPRRHAGAAGAARAPADLGRRPSQLHLALPRAALRRGDGGAARRPRSGPARRAAGADPRPGRGHPALRGRDRADAARPRRARAGGAGLPADRARSSRSRSPRRCTR